MKTLYWRPCPFYCPDEPGYFRSWAKLMAEKEKYREEGVHIDIPEGAPIPRGTHDMRGAYVDCSAGLPRAVGEPGSRCEPKEAP